VAGEETSNLTPQQLERKIELAWEVMRSLEKAVKTRRIYEPNHVLYAQVTDELVTKFMDFFEEHAYLRLCLKPTEITFEKKKLMEGKAHESEIPFRMYKDGVRELRFLRGLTRGEVVDFVGLFETDPKVLHELGEDIVSIMWSKDFHSIDYIAVDEFDFTEEIDRITGAVRMMEMLPGEGDPTGARVGVPEGSDQPFAVADHVKIPDALLREAFTRDLEPLAEQIRSEVNNETLGGVIRRSLAILLKLFQGEERPDVEHIRPLFIGVVGFYIHKGDFATLGHLMERLRGSELLKSARDGDALLRELVEASLEAATPTALARFFTREYSGDHDGSRKFLKLLGDPGLKIAAEIYGKIPDVGVRNMIKELLGEFPGKFTKDVCSALLGNAERYLVDALRIVVSMKVTGLYSVLLTYLDHPDVSVRKLVIQAGSQCEGPDRLQILRKAMEHSDPGVRTAGYEQVGLAKELSLRDALINRIRDKEFIKGEVWEKEAACIALAGCGGVAAFPILKEYADKAPPLLNRTKHQELRRAAIMGIGALQTPEAMRYLDSGVNSKDEHFRDSCRAAKAKGGGAGR
jgi:hypothetical protein